MTPTDSEHPLYLYEEILLLALRDREGTVASGTWYGLALAGALLAELALLGHVRVEQDGPLQVLDPSGTGDWLLDDCLATLSSASKPRKLLNWVSKFAGERELLHRAAEGLVQRGILRGDTAKVLLFFERRVYPELDPVPEEELIERLRGAIDSDTAEVDPRTCVLLSLAWHTGILKAVFGGRHTRARKQRIDAVIRGEALGRAAAEALEAIQMAIVFTAVVVPIIIS